MSNKAVQLRSKCDLAALVILAALSVLSLSGCVAIKDFKGNQEGSVVNLSKQGLTEFPESVFDDTLIKTLRLFGNQLDSIPSRIGELSQLESLYLGRNKITTLPPEIGNLKKLKILSLQYNELVELPAEIGELENLEQLWINVNQLKNLPPEIGKLKKLVVLNVQFNQLDSIPNEIGNCEALGFIRLNRNNLERLPESMGKLSHLKEIYLSGAGALVDIPESFCDLRFLELIQIDNSTALPACLYVLQANRLRIIH